MDYLKVGKSTDLVGRDRKIYRWLEVLPGALSWGTLLGLIVLAFWQPVWVAVFVIIFDVYWFLLVLYLGIYLFASYRQMKSNLKIDWRAACAKLGAVIVKQPDNAPELTMKWQDLIQLIIFPTYQESYEVIRHSLEALLKDGYPTDQMIVVLAMEERAGSAQAEIGKKIEREYAHYFKHFLITLHPAEIAGELKGKGANQAWAARRVKLEIIDRLNYDYRKILVSVFDIDTVVVPGYFFCLTHKFLTVANPYRASYQPVPIYNNNLWQSPPFSRVVAFSNTFWQMMQQLRPEKLATYSSHSMTWLALVDVGFWSTTMVSEDSRIFFHCFLHYNGDYRVEPLYASVSMDVCLGKNWLQTAKNLYKQQRRWGYGVENVPYLIFNAAKRWPDLPKGKTIFQIFFQIYGFHSWATNALIIAVVGWLPLLFGGDRFNTTVLSTNLPMVTQYLMNLALVGILFSATVFLLILPPRPKKFGILGYAMLLLQWALLPVTIIIFGAIPGLEAQTRFMFGKYMGFWVTPKVR